MLVVVANPISVKAAGITAVLLDSSTKDRVDLTVSANGVYKVNVEGNKPEDVLTVTASNSKLSFQLNGKTSWQLQGGIIPTDNSSVWEKITADGWFGLTKAPTATGGVYDLNEAGRYEDCGMWKINTVYKTMTWTGGGNSVHVCFNEAAKQYLLDGYEAIFTTTVEADVRACRSYWSGQDANGVPMNPYVPAGCVIFHIRPGTYSVSGWAYDEACGVQVGFRSVPVDSKPWVETKTCEVCVWPFPKGIDPTYQDAPIQPHVVVNNPPVVSNNPPASGSTGNTTGMPWYGWMLLAAILVGGAIGLAAILHRPTGTTAPAAGTAVYTAKALRAAVPGLTDAQARAILKAYPTKDSLKAASISAIGNAAQIGDVKAKLVKNASL